MQHSTPMGCVFSVKTSTTPRTLLPVGLHFAAGCGQNMFVTNPSVSFEFTAIEVGSPPTKTGVPGTAGVPSVTGVMGPSPLLAKTALVPAVFAATRVGLAPTLKV